MLQDSFNRKFNYLRLSVTEVCNFKCNYCLPDGYKCETRPTTLALAQTHTLLRAFAMVGTKKVRLTGGEPTLRKELPDIVALCNDTPGIESVALTSNGYRLAQKLPRLVDAGLTALNLSADSLSPYTFSQITGNNSLDEVLRCIDLAFELGLKKVKLNAVLLKQYNGTQLTQFLNFIKDKPVTFRFIELMRTLDNAAYFNAQHVSGQSIRTTLEKSGWQMQPKGPDAGPAVEFCHPDYAGQVGLIMPYSKDFCASCNRLRVSADGKLHLCLFGDANDDLTPWLDDGDVTGLATYLSNRVLTKWQGHQLHLGKSGLTRHLAMLGG
ncbi:GTP 3',8-cyclase MoaA [Pseudoalteromonas rubra]|uniref:GTP 3',8-cyclase MoaA n=1 Tax=Pseudoalteromonas rubra TaxID=43658 RepID=A0A5S3WMM5_9GAMM|nr:GTP 3',8-cyclase MoaA [Pseudoalteromonas rubra]TMP29072.1 GTP 3',8-cyclase MoaA [Pseudoalteromonas rubra]TMP33563.1 GTP 3',8-cyclase MoaA [Pseudoalteromonas rubra]